MDLTDTSKIVLRILTSAAEGEGQVC